MQQPPYPPQQPFYPPQQPPAPPPRKKHTKRNIGLGCLGLVIALFACVAFTSHTAGTSSNVSATPTSNQRVVIHTPTPTHVTQVKPTPMPTLLPTATPTQSPPTPTPTTTVAQLGATVSTFTARYGQPNAHSDVGSGQYHYQTYSDSNVDFLVVSTDTADPGMSQVAESITVQADTQGWSVAQAMTMCGAFYPSDAAYQRQAAVTNGPALDKIYESASLATRFPASAFTDANQNPVKPGLFDVQFLYRDSTQTVIDSCTLLIGEQQTQ